MRCLLLCGSRRHVKRTGSAQAAGDPGGSKPTAIAKPVVHLLAHFPPWQGRDGCRLVFVCNDKTSRSGCQSSTDGVACRFLEALTFPSLWRHAGIRSHGCPERRPRPVLDRPKSEFAGSLSAANALGERHNGTILQTRGLLVAQSRLLFLPPAPSIRSECPWFY